MSSAGRITPGMVGSLWDMLRFYSEKFLKAYYSVTQLEYACNEGKTGRLTDLPPEVAEAILTQIKDLIPLLEDLHLEFSFTTACELRDYFDKYRSFHALGMAGDLARRIHDELKFRYCYIITPDEQRLVEPDLPLFGAEVENAFSNASEDIGEAGKCIGFGRYTAAVFHLMRVMEAAVQKLGQKLNVTVIDKDNVDLAWGPILANLKAPVDAMQKGVVKDQWSEALSLLNFAKIAWRNPTMHPKKTYTKEQAEDVFGATRAFMSFLAPLV